MLSWLKLKRQISSRCCLPEVNGGNGGENKQHRSPLTYEATFVAFQNKHVKIVQHKHYLHASCLVKPAGDAKRALTDVLSKRKDAEQEELKIFAHTDKAPFESTNMALDKWVLEPFLSILRKKVESVENEPRDARFADANWPRASVLLRQTAGQPNLERECLPLLEKHLAVVSAVPSASAAATGGGGGATAGAAAAVDHGDATELHAFLKKLNVKKMGSKDNSLMDECRRRGLRLGGNKGALIARIENHACNDGRSGYTDLTQEPPVLYPDGRPVGFKGALPDQTDAAADTAAEDMADA